MAARGDMKGFYKQKKKSGAITKPSSKSKSSSSSKKSSSATLGTATPQPSAIISHGFLDLKDDYDANEEVLRQFDMNMAYGPCIGMSRLARWERASSLGMNPPNDVERLLRSAKVRSESLWDGHV
ncbi:hypothetical protein LguiA_019044 [Lonicera macranthoides]